MTANAFLSRLGIEHPILLAPMAGSGGTPELAAASYPVLLDPGCGFFRDGRVQEKGVRRVLRLRSRYAAERRILSDPSKYFDHHYWELARAGTTENR